MKTPFLNQARALLVAAVLPLVISAASESPSLLLQKGIYAEEVERNLDSAIKIYEQIAAESAASRAVVAQAQYRLAVCYQKKGDKAQAIKVLEELVQQLPSDADVSKKAREMLTQLGAAPVQGVSIRKVPLAVAFVWAVSDDGRFIAYEKPGAGYNLNVYETATGKSWLVYDGGNDANKEPWNVVFSPDGREIAYSIHGLTLFVANLDGTHQRKLFERKSGTGVTWFTGWLAQTGQLIVDSWDSDTQWRALFTMDPNSGATTKDLGRFTDTATLEIWDFSPDGRFLARQKRTYPRAITLVDLSTKGEATVVEGAAAHVFGWLADGSKLIYSQARTGGVDLCTIEVKDGKAAGEPKVIWPNIGTVEPVGVTRDGNIYYRVRDEKSQTRTLWVMVLFSEAVSGCGR